MQFDRGGCVYRHTRRGFLMTGLGRARTRPAGSNPGGEAPAEPGADCAAWPETATNYRSAFFYSSPALRSPLRELEFRPDLS